MNLISKKNSAFVSCSARNFVFQWRG